MTHKITYFYYTLILRYVNLYNKIYDSKIKPCDINTDQNDSHFLLDIIKQEIKNLEIEYPALKSLKSQIIIG